MLPIISTKLHVPAPPSTLVSRPRLMERLDKGVQKKMILISAPAGFGKTSLLAEWAGRKRGKADISWVHLDNNDNDLNRFWSYVIAAIQTHRAEIGEAELSGLGSIPPVPIEAVLTSLINEIDGISRDLVLILDDYHLIETHSIHDSLSYLIEHIPERMCLVVATRKDPPMPIHRLRGRGQMVEVRAGDLRFNSDETRSLLSGMLNTAFSTDDITALEERVEGWAAGLHMVALSLQGREDPHEFLTSFTGSHRYIMDYLTEEVYDLQPPDIKHFLLRTSVLNRLSGPLCDHVLRGGIDSLDLENGTRSSQQILESLERANLFLYPMDEERTWYRYHHLFAGLLLQRLRRTSPEEIGRLQRRASDWFDANGLSDEAFQYALDAEDYQAAAQIVESRGYVLLRRGALSTLMGWFNRLPPEVVRESAELNVILAWVILLTAQTVDVEENLSAAEAGDIEEDDADRLSAEIAAIRAYAAARGENVDYAMEQSKQALALLPDDEYMLRGVIYFVLGGLYSLGGSTAESLEAWRKASEYGERSENTSLAASALNSMAGTLTGQGKLAEAEGIYTRAMKLGTSPGGRALPFTASIYAGLARIYLARGEDQRAREYAKSGFELGKQWVNADSQIGSLLTLAQVAQREGNPGEAQELLDQVDRLAATRMLMPGMQALIEGVRSMITAQQESKVQVEGLIEPLTERELELLSLIAVGRSNPEIAEALVIAVGTVKAHTSSIYRKLDVSNRTEAVMRAKELGLL